MNKSDIKKGILVELNRKHWSKDVIEFYLKQIPSKKIKLDETFIADIDESQLKELLLAASKVCDTSPELIISKNRSRKNTYARSMIFKNIRERGTSWEDTGYVLNRSHTTAINAVKNLDNLIEIHNDARFEYNMFMEIVKK